MIQEIAEEELTWIRDHGCQATTTDLERDVAAQDLLNLALEAEKDKEKDLLNTQWAKIRKKCKKNLKNNVSLKFFQRKWPCTTGGPENLKKSWQKTSEIK